MAALQTRGNSGRISAITSRTFTSSDAISCAAEKRLRDYQYPGHGQGRVRDILKDALARGYNAGISIEPHVAAVFHDATVQSNDQVMFDSYIRYGRELEKMIADLKAELQRRSHT